MKTILGLALIAFGVFLEITWLGICFGTIIIGILLLLFAPRILFFPFNLFLVIGIAIMKGNSYSYRESFRFNNGFNYNSSSNTNSFNNFSSDANLDRYYEVLESSREDDLHTIKSNYRRLIKEYHYDSIASKNLPPDMLKYAKIKTQDLNEAYTAIKEHLSKRD